VRKDPPPAGFDAANYSAPRISEDLGGEAVDQRERHVHRLHQRRGRQRVADDLAGRGFERGADLVDADVFAALGRELDVGDLYGLGVFCNMVGILPSSSAKGLSTTRQR